MDHPRASDGAQCSGGQPCLLESLPSEVLMELMAALCSMADLRALISASPTFFRLFRSAKKEVLVNMVAWDLGAGLRDCIAATLITPNRLTYGDVEYAAKCRRVLDRYAALPGRDGGILAARGLSADEALALVWTNRSVQFFVDEYHASKVADLRRIHPDAAYPLTAGERRRIGQALLRHQVLARIQAGDALPAPAAVLRGFFALFRPWEMQQLADIHGFVCEMVWEAHRYCHEERTAGFRAGRRKTTLDAALCDLAALHKKLLEERARLAADPGLVERTPEVPFPFELEMAGHRTVSGRYGFLGAGPLPRQVGADRVAEEHQGLRDDLYQREDEMPPLVFNRGDDLNDAAPPFGWVDAHGGLNCQRWGRYVWREVIPAGQATTTGHQRDWMKYQLRRWRWCGFAFWDRARVELLKSRLPEYYTGFLASAPPPDTKCYLRGTQVGRHPAIPTSYGLR